jgi:molybdate transport system ATP-binding protein
MQRLDLIPATGVSEAGAIVEAVVERHEDRYALTVLRSRAGIWRVPRLDAPPGKAVRMQIKARDVMIALARPAGMSALNVIEARVVETGPMDGPSVEIKLDCNGEALVARLTRYSAEHLALRAGKDVFAIVKSVSLNRENLGAAWSDLRAADASATREG